MPADVPKGCFGPRAVLALLSGGYRIGKSCVSRLAEDLFGQSISAMVAKLEQATAEALEEPYEEMVEHVQSPT